MENTPPKKLEILLLEGLPSGLRYLDIKNWVGRAFVCPRVSLPKLLNRAELSRAGNYVLVGNSENNELPEIYIGEADNVKNRLPMHQIKKDFWNEVIVFISQDELLDKAGVRYIESKLIQDALADGLCNIQNGVNPPDKNVSEADRAVLDEFIKHMKLMLLVLGYKIFRFTDEKSNDYEELVLSVGNITATGQESEEGFLIKKGSHAAINTSNSVSSKFVKLKEELVKKGVLIKENELYLFTQDYLLSSPSYASAMVLGYASNGRFIWKNHKGIPLKEIQVNKLAK